MQASAEPDYEKLRAILELELGKEVSLEYATGAGNYLVNVYSILLYDDEETDDKGVKLTMDTTNNGQ
jgi:sugar phosphate isomerase/epimerase